MEGQEKIKDTIAQLLEDIVTRTHSLTSNPSGAPELDIDIILDDLRMLYRQYGLLKKPIADSNDTHASAPETQSAQEEALDQPVIPSFFNEPEPDPDPDPDGIPHVRSGLRSAQPEPEPQPQPDPDGIPHVRSGLRSAQPQPEPQPQPDPDGIPHMRSGLRSAQPEPQPEPQPDPDGIPHVRSGLRSAQPQPSGRGNGKSFIDLFSQEPAKAIGDQLSINDNSVHQRISSQKEDKSIGARMQQQAVSNIKEAIGLNEKFLFINELFNGNIDAYNTSISNLNNKASLSEAFEYLNELTTQYAWDASRSAVTIEKLAGFVQRRYMTD